MEKLNEEVLRNMPYSALKNYAREHGVKGNLKADRMISLLLSESSVASDDSFVLEEQRIINSFNEKTFDDNKENSFCKKKISFLDSSCSELKIESRTSPRRGRYSKGSPLVRQVNEEKQNVLASTIQENDFVNTFGELLKIESQSATPRQKTSTKESSNVPQINEEEQAEVTAPIKQNDSASTSEIQVKELLIETSTTTPRRETYTKDSPFPQVKDEKQAEVTAPFYESSFANNTGTQLKIKSRTSTPRRGRSSKGSLVRQVNEEKQTEKATHVQENDSVNNAEIPVKDLLIQTSTSTPRRETYTKESPLPQVNEEKQAEVAAPIQEIGFINTAGIQADELLIQTSSSTPRRETYTKDSPLPQVNGGVEPAASFSSCKIFSTDSPLPQIMVTDETNCTVKPSSSSKKQVKRLSASLKKSRKSSKQKVSFVTPVRCSPRLSGSPSGSEFISVKDRPKTPFSGSTSKKAVKFQNSHRVAPYKKISDFLKSRRSTPCRFESSASRSSFGTGGIEIDESPTAEVISGITQNDSISERAPEAKEEASVSVISTPGINKRDSSTPLKSPGRRSKLVSPKLSTLKKTGSHSVKKTVFTPGSKASLHRTKTPDFKKIHQKQFEKMESIDEYQKRKLEYSAKKIAKKVVVKKEVVVKKKSKSKIPYAFVPIVTNTKDLKLDFSVNPLVRITRSQKAADSGVKVFSAETNAVVTKPQCHESLKKPKFDLEASLKRKLNYKPYTGALKPFEDKTASRSACVHTVKNGVEKIKSTVRSARQDGAKNRRYALQMSRRML